MTVAKVVGFAMHMGFNIEGSACRIRLLAVLITLVVAHTVSAQPVSVVPANIFGDGNPGNGIEDSREPIAALPGEDAHNTLELMNAGTVTCDGKFRGTAMVADIRELTSDVEGVVLVSAAHVIYDLDKKRRFRRCRFHFMGWETSTGYSSKIDLKRIRMGNFDPRQMTSGLAFGKGDWVFLYIPKPWRNYQSDQSIQLRNFMFSNTESFQQSGGEFRLVAFDTVDGLIKQSRNCTVLESGSDDIGGGAWKGQLLDDCDSTDGASGGGILALLDNQHFLIGIRNGSHWSERAFPVDRFPLGPADGSRWNRHSNTNFGRAIDANILHEFDEFIQVLIE